MEEKKVEGARLGALFGQAELLAQGRQSPAARRALGARGESMQPLFMRHVVETSWRPLAH